VVSLSDQEIVPEPDRDATLAYGRELEIAALKGHAGLRLLREALADAEQAMQEHVGRNVMTSGKAVDQRQLDYTRGYYDGARFWLEGRIILAEQRAALQKAAEERPGDDPRPSGRIDPRTGEPRTEGVDQA
jgi:hypothetical protein